MSSTEPEPSAPEANEHSEEEVADDPESPGLAAMKPLDDPSRSDAEPNEPA